MAEVLNCLTAVFMKMKNHVNTYELYVNVSPGVALDIRKTIKQTSFDLSLNT